MDKFIIKIITSFLKNLKELVITVVINLAGTINQSQPMDVTTKKAAKDFCEKIFIRSMQRQLSHSKLVRWRV